MTPEQRKAIARAFSVDDGDIPDEDFQKAIQSLGQKPPHHWTPQEFKDTFYDEKWKDQGLTAWHPERLPKFWTAASTSSWLLLGDNPNQIIAVKNGTIDPSHKTKRFRVKSILEIPLDNAPRASVERPKSLSATPIPEDPVRPLEPAEKGAFSPIPAPDIPPLSESGVHYAAWALDCLNSKRYSDAKSHLETALRKSGYYG